MSEGGTRIFLSYSRSDEPFARRLAELVERRGVAVFDPRRMAPGESISDTIRRELEKTSAVIMVVPGEGVSNRNQVWFEAGAARALGKRVLAVLPPSQMARRLHLPSDLADMIVLDADERPLERIANTLANAAIESGSEAAAAV